jgi:hypothetical protein
MTSGTLHEFISVGTEMTKWKEAAKRVGQKKVERGQGASHFSSVFISIYCRHQLISFFHTPPQMPFSPLTTPGRLVFMSFLFFSNSSPHNLARSHFSSPPRPRPQFQTIFHEGNTSLTTGSHSQTRQQDI